MLNFIMQHKSILFILILSTSLCFTPCFGGAPNKSGDSKSNNMEMIIMSIPEVGTKLNTEKISTFDQMLVSSGQFYPGYHLIVGGIKFEVAINREQIIKYVSTDNPKFKTGEGVSVENTLAQVLKKTKGKTKKEAGWAFFVTLKSGWNAAFTQGNTMTEGELDSGSKVKWLFKR